MTKLDWDREHRQGSVGPINGAAGGLIEHIHVPRSLRVRSLYRRTVKPYGHVCLGWGPGLASYHLQVNDAGWIPLRIVGQVLVYLRHPIWSIWEDHDEDKPPRPYRFVPNWDLNDISYWVEKRNGRYVIECRQGSRGPVRSAPYNVCLAVECQWKPAVYAQLTSLHRDHPDATAAELVKILRTRSDAIPNLHIAV